MTMDRHFAQGSEWRVWDLHLHTPASYDYDDMSVTNPQIVDRLVDSGVAVAAVTDHHTMDCDRIAELQSLGGDRLTVLPGIEVRTELGGSNSVHLIGLFPEECNTSEVWEVLKVTFKIPKQIRDVGDEGVFVRFEEFADKVHELGGLVSVHAGTKTNGIEEISNHTAYKRALKTGLAKKAVDIYEIGKRADASEYAKKVFPVIKKTLPTVLAVDSHDARSYAPPTTWIKADPCFLGLRQVIYDPVNRVSLEDKPPAIQRFLADNHHYMTAVSFSKAADSTLTEKWFDGVTVPLSQGLITIIGNKGSGKSALAEALGLLGSCPHVKSYSFLSKDKFLRGRHPKAESFDVSVTWGDGRTATCNLADTPDGCQIPQVRHLPQNYLESICNDVQTDEESAFRQELEAVVFSHIDERATHGKSTLRQVVDFRKSQIAATLAQRREALSQVNARIIATQGKLLSDHKADLEAKLDEIGQKIKALGASRPAEVKAPTPGRAEAVLTKKAEKLRGQIEKVTKELEENSLERQRQTDLKVSAGKLLGAVANLEEYQRELRSTWDREKGTVDLSVDDVITLTIDKGPLDRVIAAANVRISTLKREANPDVPDTLADQKKKLSGQLKDVQDKLSLPSKQHQDYLEALKKWEKKRQKLIGDGTVAGTQKSIENELNELATLPEALRDLKKERSDRVRDIYQSLDEWADIYRDLYKPVREYIDEHQLTGIEFDVSVRNVRLEKPFFEIVSRAKAGSFHGEGESVLKEALEEADFSSSNGAVTFADGLVALLETDARGGEPASRAIDAQLKERADMGQLYDLIFSLKYLEPSYSLRWCGKGLDQLSPGEKGALLLVFYLVIDQTDCPLILDQPEENLDNETVSKMLVESVNEARGRRQVIMVTHNPNLAVVCDADQVIRARIDVEDGFALSYESGGIENPRINQAIVDVLEGTRPAFDKRDLKYKAAAPLE